MPISTMTFNSSVHLCQLYDDGSWWEWSLMMIWWADGNDCLWWWKCSSYHRVILELCLKSLFVAIFIFWHVSTTKKVFHPGNISVRRFLKLLRKAHQCSWMYCFVPFFEIDPRTIKWSKCRIVIFVMICIL